MDSDELLAAAAVRNNASWCDAVRRSHAFPGVFDWEPAETASSSPASSPTPPATWSGSPNLFGADRFHTSALQAVATLHPNLPVVGYEHGTDLATAKRTGAQSLGPLRVWTQ